MKHLFVLPVVFASACTVVGHERVEDWPELQVVEHRVPHAAMRDRCMPYTPLLMSPEACAEFDFAALRCHVWLSADFPPPASVVRHEHLHCRGYDHVGSQGMRLAWKNYLSVQSAANVSVR